MFAQGDIILMLQDLDTQTVICTGNVSSSSPDYGVHNFFDCIDQMTC